VVIVMVAVIKMNRRDGDEKGVIETMVVTLLKMVEMSRTSRQNGRRSGGRRCCQRRGARTLAKHGGRLGEDGGVAVLWRDLVVVVILEKEKEMVYMVVFWSCGGINGDGEGIR